MHIAITALGMMTSVGHDAVTSCAAIRAGIQRPHELHYFSVLDHEEQETKPLIGRPIHGISTGFTGIGLWLRLGCAAAQQMPLPDAADVAFWQRTGLCVVLPELESERFTDDERIAPHNLQEDYIASLLEVLGWRISYAYRHVISAGHVGALAAIIWAEALMRSNELERVLVVCVDSYLDPLSLEWLAQEERLKLEDNPFGLIPGEASVCFMLEAPAAAVTRGVMPMGIINTCHLEQGTASPRPGAALLGEALASTITHTLQTAQITQFSGLVISDLNGEPWRARDWGAARMRLGQRLSEKVCWMLPSESLGDTGAASAAVALCLGTQALQRGYAGGDTVLVSACSMMGTVGSMCLARC